MITHPRCRVVVQEKSIGTFQGKDIPSFIVCADGSRHEFVGTFENGMELDTLKRGECVIAPGLIYREVSA